VYHTKYGFYQFCFRVRIVGLVLIREVLLSTCIYRQTQRHILRDGCICYIEGCLVVYTVSESDFVRKVVVYVCSRVIYTCHKY